MRARYPDTEGSIERDGVKIAYEVFGSGPVAVVFAPADTLVNARVWKAQVPYLAREFTVVTIDPRGNGRSDRPQSPAAYADTEFAADTIAVLDAAAARAAWDFDTAYDTDEGWARDNRRYWRRDWRGYAEFFFGELLPEPHSTKQHEDAVGWALETDAETMLCFEDAPMSSQSRAETEALLARAPGHRMATMRSTGTSAGRSTASSFRSVRDFRLPISPSVSSVPSRVTPNVPARRSST